MWPCVPFHTIEKHAYRTFNRTGTFMSPRAERLLGIEQPLADQIAEQRRQFWLQYHYFPEDTPMTDTERKCILEAMTEQFQKLLAVAAADRVKVEELEAQLPERMKHCTILFKECEKGHGWLTATNWIDHGCPTCAIAAERAKVEKLRKYAAHSETCDTAFRCCTCGLETLLKEKRT